jgi:hypothetical protein
LHKFIFNMDTVLIFFVGIVPSLIIAATTYSLLNSFFKNELNLRAHQLRQNQQDVTVPMKFAALERFALLCERIHLPNVAMRVAQGVVDADAKTMYYGMLMSIQQEFEHNIAQQIYVSPDLWEIIRKSKEETVDTATHLYHSLPEHARGNDFFDLILKFYNDDRNNLLAVAQLAIKKEAALILPA